jgi:hypothetical protein
VCFCVFYFYSLFKFSLSLNHCTDPNFKKQFLVDYDAAVDRSSASEHVLRVAVYDVDTAEKISERDLIGACEMDLDDVVRGGVDKEHAFPLLDPRGVRVGGGNGAAVSGDGGSVIVKFGGMGAEADTDARERNRLKAAL